MNRLVPRVGPLILVCALMAIPVLARGAVCPTSSTIVVDTVGADTTVLAFIGRGTGQTFFASDTLIKSITVFRTAYPETNATPVTLYITVVDAAGRPHVTSVIEGPTLVFPPSDGIHALPCTFALDPPIALPHAGTWYFTIKEATCYSAFNLIAKKHDPYPGGHVWENIGSIICTLGSVYDGWPDLDLCFTIEFCGTSTAARSVTWGKLKTLYR